MISTQNADGQWVPAIPLPFYGWKRKQCFGLNERGTICGRWFWTMEGYRGHYALAHIVESNR